MVGLSPKTLPLGAPAPDFSLTDVITGENVSFSDYAANKKAVVVMFICNHCPYVIHVRGQFGPIAEEYMPKGIGILAINSNSVVTHPQDGPRAMKLLAEEMNWSFPFLFDGSQDVAKAFKAVCTPEFFVFDEEKKLVYHGQLDDSRPRNTIPVTGKDLRAVLDAVLEGKPVNKDQKSSIGCSIKWHPGNEPE
ncbi:MAG: thioredoxin family protein [Candidatus Hermodarchaeota archaeon]